MKNLMQLFCLVFLLSSANVDAQLFKKKSKKNKFECGYVHKKTLKERLNLGAVVGKVVGGLFVKGSSNFEFENAALTIGRNNHIYPEGFVDMSFKVPGWQACGDFVTSTSTSKLGLPMIKTSSFAIDGTPYESVVFGQYMQGFPHKEVSKTVVVSDSKGNKIKVELNSLPAFKIKSVNGVPRWDTSLKFDGKEDLVIELENNVQENTFIGVELHNKISGIRFNSPVFFCNDKNTITIPKEAFNNSLKFIEDNMLIIYKYKETLLDNLVIGGGAIRKIETYTDFTPITITGDMTKSMFVKAWKKENKKVVQKDLSKVTSYDFEYKKADPLYYYPSSAIKKVVIPSFVLRGNLKHTHKDIETQSTTSSYETATHKVTRTMTTTTTRTMTKYFPELEKNTWQDLADRLYNGFKKSVEEAYNVPVVDVRKIVESEAYKNIFPIQDTVTKTFVEVGAFNTRRVLPSIKHERQTLTTTGNKEAADAKKMANKGTDLTIAINTFPSDFVTSRVMRQFDANCAITVNFDLEFDIQAEALLPVVNIKFYAPSKSFNTMSYYHEIKAYYKESISIKDANKFQGSTVDKIYEMINGDKFVSELVYTLNQIKESEQENDTYQKMWDAMQ